MKLLPFVVVGLFLLAGCLNKEETAPSTSDEEYGPQLKPFLFLPFRKGTAYRIAEGWTFSKEEQAIHGYIKHRGIDFAAKRGTPILAAADGWAVASYHLKATGRIYQEKSVGDGFGLFVQLWHPAQGVCSQYGHLDKISGEIPYLEPEKVPDGWDPKVIYRPSGTEIPGWKWVHRGQVVGYMGDTGLTWGYEEEPNSRPDPGTHPSWDEVHLHFEVYNRGPDGQKNVWFDPFGIEGSVADYQDTSKPREGELWLRNEFGLVFADE